MKLLLFDIDGTILLTHGVGRRSVETALQRVLGRAVSTEGIRFSGKTDPQILREVLLRAGLDAEANDGTFDEVVDAYAAAMRETLEPERVTLLPGIRPLIEQLHAQPDVQLALVTGNLEPMAYLKLAAVGLDGYFPFGAFGSDSPHRPDLPPLAVTRAEAHTGRRFTGKDVVIIGDTEHDVHCGRGIGAFAVAVCTGKYSRADLEPLAPDLLLDDLEQPSLLLDTLRLAS